ncbi:unnamed protein product [Euphydryas editha]|uniref:Uncharacterized protein n=1 Tax=Euphydryas editha TaxID=104508 RepID=A0AAU9U491_EUPED|nr:unnamed protein product [Euphydryas editha]
MHKKDQIPLFPYSLEEKEAILKELGLKENLIEEDIDAIIEWFYKQPHLAKAPIDRDFVEKIIMTAKGSREKAKRKIDHFYKHRSLAQELVQSRKEVLLDPEIELWTF